MKYIVGVDFGASQNVYTLAEYETGKIVTKKEVPQGAFYKAPNLPDEAPRVLDAYRNDLPTAERTHVFLTEGVKNFLQDAHVKNEDIMGIVSPSPEKRSPTAKTKVMLPSSAETRPNDSEPTSATDKPA